MSASTITESLPLSASHLLFRASQTPQPNLLDKFTRFSFLPTELRIAIYKYALSPRILTLHYNGSTNTFTSPTPLPALLSTNRESRITTQKHYCLYFGTTSSEARIYFNPWLDTLYLPRCGEMGYDENFRNLRNLIKEKNNCSHTTSYCTGNRKAEQISRLDNLRGVAIDHVDPSIKRPWEGYNKASFIRGFPLLQEIILVLSPEEEKISSCPMNPSTATPSQRKQITKSFRDPRLPPEEILQIWCCFRQSFTSEEHLFEEVCNELGENYEVHSLPTVRVRGKVDTENMPRERLTRIM